MNPKKIGNFGERIACHYLKNKGYEILDRNYKKDWTAADKGEIDIVCKKDNIISFVEVKTVSREFGRQNTLPHRREVFSPEKKVNFQKQRKLVKLAQNWLLENKIPLSSKWQIDVVAVKIDLDAEKARIKHFQNAVC